MVVQSLAWQWIFRLNVPVSLTLIPLISRYMAEARGPRTPFDAAGLACRALASAGVGREIRTLQDAAAVKLLTWKFSSTPPVLDISNP